MILPWYSCPPAASEISTAIPVFSRGRSADGENRRGVVLDEVFTEGDVLRNHGSGQRRTDFIGGADHRIAALEFCVGVAVVARPLQQRAEQLLRVAAGDHRLGIFALVLQILLAGGRVAADQFFGHLEFGAGQLLLFFGRIVVGVILAELVAGQRRQQRTLFDPLSLFDRNPVHEARNTRHDLGGLLQIEPDFSGQPQRGVDLARNRF